MNLDKINECLIKLNQTVKCVICFQIAKAPLTSSCGHIFCSECISDKLKKKRSFLCPSCSKSISKRLLKESEKLKEISSVIQDVFSEYENRDSISKSIASTETPNYKIHIKSSKYKLSPPLASVDQTLLAQSNSMEIMTQPMPGLPADVPMPKEKPPLLPNSIKKVIARPPLPSLLKVQTRKRNRPIQSSNFLNTEDIQYMDAESSNESKIDSTPSKKTSKKFKRSNTSSTNLSKQSSSSRFPIARFSSHFRSKSESCSPSPSKNKFPGRQMSKFALRKFRSFDPVFNVKSRSMSVPSSSEKDKDAQKNRFGSFLFLNQGNTKLKNLSKSKYFRRNSDSFLNNISFNSQLGSEKESNSRRRLSSLNSDQIKKRTSNGSKFDMERLNNDVCLLKVTDLPPTTLPPLPSNRSHSNSGRTTCKFVAPFKGLLSRRRSRFGDNRRISLANSPSKINLRASRTSLSSSGSLACSPRWSIDSCRDVSNSPFKMFHCSSCGEMMPLHQSDIPPIIQNKGSTNSIHQQKTSTDSRMWTTSDSYWKADELDDIVPENYMLSTDIDATHEKPYFIPKTELLNPPETNNNLDLSNDNVIPSSQPSSPINQEDKLSLIKNTSSTPIIQTGFSLLTNIVSRSTPKMGLAVAIDRPNSILPSTIIVPETYQDSVIHQTELTESETNRLFEQALNEPQASLVE